MVKTMLVTVEGDIPETEIGKTATISIETRNYTGVVRAIIIHEEEVATVTLQAQGLKVVPA